MSIPHTKILNTSGGLTSTIISAVVLHVLEIIMFFGTVLVVNAGAELAGYDPGGRLIILAAAILSAGSAIAGGLEHLKSEINQDD